MSSEWPQRAFGKLVESVGGKIRGDDYETTGRSETFPELAAGAPLAASALGITNREQWEGYPKAWTRGGLFLRRQFTKDGVPSILASRLRARREDPDDPTSRYFVEVRHAIHPVESLNFGELFQLFDRLEPESLVAPDPKLQPLVLDGADPLALPPGWFETCRDYLVAIAGGGVLHVRAPELSAAEFYRRALWAVACLPGAIRWRVPIAAGVYALPTAKGSVRYALTLTYESGDKAVGDSAAGEAYARWFADFTEKGQTCTTVQELLRCVERMHPELTAWNALPEAESYDRAVTALSEIKVLEELDSWIKNPTGAAPPIAGFVHRKGAALKKVVGSLDRPASVTGDLLLAVRGEGWKSAWQGLVQAEGASAVHRALSQLLGMLSPLDSKVVAESLEEKAFELPSSLHGDIHKALSERFGSDRAAAGLARWEGLLRRAFQVESPVWFGTWVVANAPQLVWSAVQLRFENQIDVTTSWKAKVAGAPAAVKALLQQQSPAEKQFEALLGIQADARPGVPEALQKHITAALPREAVRMALARNAAAEVDTALIVRGLREETFELLPSLHTSMQALLTERIGSARTKAERESWEWLLRRAFGKKSPAWFAAWVAQNQAKLVGLAVQFRFDQPPIDVTTDWVSPMSAGAPAAIKALLELKRPTDSDFEALLDIVPDGKPELVSLLNYIVAKLPREAIRIALAREAVGSVWLNPQLVSEKMRAAPDVWVRAATEIATQNQTVAEPLAKGLMAVWDRLTEAERNKLKPQLAPYLGYLDSILFGLDPNLDPHCVPAEWAWPVAKHLCASDNPRQRNVLLAACRGPALALADDNFLKYLLCPVLERPDVATQVPPNAPILKFALELRAGKPGDLPHASRTEDWRAAQLWLKVLKPKAPAVRPKTPKLSGLEQIPIAVQYQDYLQKPIATSASFKCKWVKMIAKPDDREYYLKWVRIGKLESEDWWRFANGWETIRKPGKTSVADLTSGEEKEIRSDPALFQAYLSAVVDGAPLTYKILDEISFKNIQSACESPEATQLLWEKCVKRGGHALIAVKFWRNCWERTTPAGREQLNRDISSMTLGKVFRLITAPGKPDDIWYRLADVIYKKSPEIIKKHMLDDLQGDAGGNRGDGSPSPSTTRLS